MFSNRKRRDHQHIDLRRRVALRKINQVKIINFDAEQVLSSMEEHLKNSILPIEKKNAICRCLTGQCKLARRMFMQIDDSVLPSSYWNPESGTISSESGTISSTASTTASSDGQHEAELVNAEPNIAPNNEQDPTISASLNNFNFIEKIILSIGIILDPNNVENHTFEDYWLEFRYNVISDVGLMAGIAGPILDEWIHQAAIQ